MSFEIEADRGMDLDGINNIKPWRDKPNLDKADDGLKLHELDFSHCELHTFPVLISVNPKPWAAASSTAAATALTPRLRSRRPSRPSATTNWTGS